MENSEINNNYIESMKSFLWCFVDVMALITNLGPCPYPCLVHGQMRQITNEMM